MLPPSGVFIWYIVLRQQPQTVKHQMSILNMVMIYVHDLNMSSTPLGFCSSHVRGGKTYGVWRREEVAEALLGQVSILIVIEGLA